MIELKNIIKKFGSVTAVKNFNLKISKKEKVVIFGHSGCGKTTLLRLIAGFETPDKGEIIINGQTASTNKIILAPRRRKIGMVFQDLALWPHMNVMQNIGFGLENVIKNKQDREKEILRVLSMVHLEKKENSSVVHLSGGEQQRVALARAIIMRPDILLLDEPLANLDFELKEKLVALIDSLQSRMDITLVYVTHDRFVAKVLADRTICMAKGRIKEIKHSGVK